MISVTADFGVEAGLAEFHCTDVASLLPPWMDPDEIIVEDGGLSEVVEAPAREEWYSSWILQWAMPIPGHLHIVSNLLEEVHGKLPYWPVFDAQCMHGVGQASLVQASPGAVAQ